MTAETSIDPLAIPLRGMRGMAADHMVKSLATAAQLTHHAGANCKNLFAEKSRLAQAGTKLSIEDLLIFCVVQALKKHPNANGRVVDRNILLSDAINLSVAISLPDDLLVAPAIFGIESMSVADINAARKDLAIRARKNKITVQEMTEGTFTVSNLGLTRVEQFTPIINLPQICILGVGCVTETAVRGADTSVEFNPFINLSLTFDHRALNGEPAGQFLTTLCNEIESFTTEPALA